jgi:hypothetical protein
MSDTKEPQDRKEWLEQTPHIRQLPHSGERMETGPVRFGDDWAGVFIRGDSALVYAMYIEQIIEESPNITDDIILFYTLEGLLDVLKSCRE